MALTLNMDSLFEFSLVLRPSSSLINRKVVSEYCLLSRTEYLKSFPWKVNISLCSGHSHPLFFLVVRTRKTYR